MANNKIIYGNQTLIDLTDDTVSTDNLLSGATAHDRSGASIVGSVTVPSDLDDLSDVDISSVANGNIIRYNNTSSKWENADGDSYWLSRSGGSVSGNISLKKYASSSDTISLTIGGKVQENQSGVIGNLKLVNYSDGVIRLSPSSGSGSSPLINVPFKSGTIALTDDIPTDFVPASTGGTFESDIVIDKADGTTSVVGQSKVVLGNSTLSSADENSKGVVRLYSRGSKFVDICAPDGSAITDDRELNVPDKSGTIALTSDLPTDFVPKSSGGSFESDISIVKSNSSTSTTYSNLTLGNDIPNGTEGATHGVITLYGRTDKKVDISADLSNNDRVLYIPNAGGYFVTASAHYGKSISNTANETWKNFLNRLRDGYFADGMVRRNVLRFSTLDGQSNFFLHCDRFRNQDTSVWGGFRIGPNGIVFYSLIFGGSSSVNLRKGACNTSNVTTVEDLTEDSQGNPTKVSTSAEAVTITIL